MSWRDLPLAKKQRFVDVAQSHIVYVCNSSDEEEDKEETVKSNSREKEKEDKPKKTLLGKRIQREKTEKKEEKEKKGKKEKKEKPPRVSMLAQEGVDDVGTVVGNDEYGEWRNCPGFTAKKLLVSSMGYVKTRQVKNKLAKSHTGYQNGKGYCVVNIDGIPYRVHLIVLRAFKGPQPSPEMSADHINQTRFDNRIENLRWATKTEQRVNQRKHSNSNCTGKPIFVRIISWPVTTPSLWFESAAAASRAIGIQNLQDVANPDTQTKTRYDKYGNRWVAKRAPAVESQEDLLADLDYVDAKGNHKPQPAEEWKNAYYYGKRIQNMRVSNRARVQIKHNHGKVWGHKHTPKPRDEEYYALVGSGKAFHVMVLSSFGIIPHGYDVDHLDENKSNNLLSNLEAKTRSGNLLNVTRKPISKRNNSKKDSIEARHKDALKTTPWQWYESKMAAARALKVDPSSISAHLKGHKNRSHVGGYVFRCVE